MHTITITVPEGYTSEDMRILMIHLNSYSVNFKPLGIDKDGTHKLVSSREDVHPGHDNIVLS